jgi:hypothetical protein
LWAFFSAMLINATALLSTTIFIAVFGLTALRRRLGLGAAVMTAEAASIGVRAPAAQQPDGHLFE